MDVALVRELVDASVRPGQPRGSLAVSRLLSIPLLTSGRPVGANRYDWTEETSFQVALYGRAHYGTDRYVSAS